MFGGKMWKLLVNDGLNMLYGGFDSFDVKVWMVIGMYSDVIGLSVMLCYVSFDGENGFFGMLMIDVIYMLICDNQICIDYCVMMDKDMVVNLINYSYFNLVGQVGGSVEW